MYPIILEFSGHFLSSWVFMASLGVWAGFFSFLHDAEKRQIPLNQVVLAGLGEVFIWFMGAIIGQAMTVGNPTIEIGPGFKLSGLMLYGGLIASIAYATLVWRPFGWNKKMLLSEFWDIGSLMLAWVFFFGRLGCFLFGCCYGTPSGAWPGYYLKWDQWEKTGRHFPVGLLHLKLHPAPLYEAFGFLVIILMVYWLRYQEEKSPGKYPPGVLGWFVWIPYGVIRFLLEFIRLDPRGTSHLGLFPSQWISIFVVGLGAIAITHDFKAERTPIYRLSRNLDRIRKR